jgi:hypothetical protein
VPKAAHRILQENVSAILTPRGFCGTADPRGFVPSATVLSPNFIPTNSRRTATYVSFLTHRGFVPTCACPGASRRAFSIQIFIPLSGLHKYAVSYIFMCTCSTKTESISQAAQKTMNLRLPTFQTEPSRRLRTSGEFVGGPARRPVESVRSLRVAVSKNLIRQHLLSFECSIHIAPSESWTVPGVTDRNAASAPGLSEQRGRQTAGTNPGRT